MAIIERHHRAPRVDPENPRHINEIHIGRHRAPGYTVYGLSQERHMAAPLTLPPTEYVPCDHPIQKLRERVYRNGTTHYVRQCEICGCEVAKLRKESLSHADREVMTRWDDTIHPRYVERRRARHAREAEARLAAMRARYDEYLSGPEWQRRRQARLDYDQRRCQARLDGCTGVATEVHHLSYRFCGNEPIFDLVSICRSCHEQVSEMEGRGARVSVPVGVA